VTRRWGISFPASRSHHITLAETLSTNVTDLIPSTAEITAAGEQLDRAGFGAYQQTVLGTEMGRVVMKRNAGSWLVRVPAPSWPRQGDSACR
jgi:hypothetical protein